MDSLLRLGAEPESGPSELSLGGVRLSWELRDSEIAPFKRSCKQLLTQTANQGR